MFNKQSRTFFMVPYVIWLVLFVIFPLCLIVFYSFRDIHGHFTLANYKAFMTPTYLWMTVYSFWYAFLITFICLIISYPLAYVIRFTKHKQMWLLLIILPTWINLLLKTYAFIGLFGQNGSVNKFLASLGLGTHQLLFNGASFVFVAVYIFIPFMVLPIYNSIEGLNTTYISAAKDLGANNWITFTRVIWPLTIAGVKTAIQTTFIPALSLFMITRLIAGNKVINLGTSIEEHFLVTQNTGMGATIAVFLTIIMVIVMILTGTTGVEKMKGASKND